jgi:hypothetical protein
MSSSGAACIPVECRIISPNGAACIPVAANVIITVFGLIRSGIETSILATK